LNFPKKKLSKGTKQLKTYTKQELEAVPFTDGTISPDGTMLYLAPLPNGSVRP